MDWSAPPTELILHPSEVHLWQIGLNQPPVGLWELLSLDEQERAQRFHFERHRQAFVVARGALRTILSRYVGVPASTLSFAYGRQGKPRLAMAGSLQFNLSHSGEIALLGVTHLQTVGIDVEQIRELPDMLGVAEHFFARAEYEQLLQLPTNRHPQAFFECWTRKEAYLKAIGEGLTRPLDQFRVSFGDGQPPRLLSVVGYPDEAGQWSLKSVVPALNYIAAVIVPAQNWSLHGYCFHRDIP